ncbi:MAG: hypothetical protein ACP5QU_02385 [Anaerolineae bacterium]
MAANWSKYHDLLQTPGCVTARRPFGLPKQSSRMNAEIALPPEPVLSEAKERLAMTSEPRLILLIATEPSWWINFLKNLKAESGRCE